MRDSAAAVDSLNNLKVDLLGDDWVEEVWNQEFADYDPIKNDYQELLTSTDYHRENLKHALSCLKKCVEDSIDFWTSLIEDVSRKGLIALLFYLFDVGQKKVASFTQKEASILAADVYFTLIRIPGSGAFKIYHPVLFEKMVNLFKSWDTLEASGGRSKQKSQQGKSSQSKGKRSSRRSEEDPFEDDTDTAMETDEIEKETQLTLQEAIKLQKGMINTLKTFVQLLEAYSLKESEHVLNAVSHTLAELSRYETDMGEMDFEEDVPASRMRTVSQLAFKGMGILINGSHGDIKKRTNAVFKFLLPSLLMLVGKNRKSTLQNITRDVIHTKDIALMYVCHILKKNPSGVAVSASHLIQQMCIQVPDKVDYRMKVAQEVIDIIKLFPLIEYAKAIEWVYKFSRSNKIGRRVFGLDLAVLLLAQPERNTENTADVPEEYKVFLTHRFLMEMVLSRCSDVASSVRTRAIAVFSQCAESPEAPVTNAIRDLVTPLPVQRAPVSRLPPGLAPTDSMGQGRESTGSLPGPIPILHISAGSIADGAAGASSVEVSARTSTATVVTAPGSFATENITPQNSGCGSELKIPSAMKTVALTPGMGITMADGKGMSSMLRSRAGDKKVNVRKSSLQALESIICLIGEGYNSEDIDVIKERCQDPALSVRKQAVQSLNNLLYHKPTEDVFQKAFLDGVVPLVMDRETSVQEKCIETLESVIFSNIVPHHKSVSDKHKLAWSLLNRMAGNEEVELRAYLMKIFQHWGRQSKIKVSLINAVLSHIGTDNNPGTWMFLAAMAQFAPKFNTEPIVNYWNDTAKHSSENEYHTVGRVLNVLGHVAKYISKEDLAVLANDLKEKLMQFNLPAELTSATISTLNKLCCARENESANTSLQTSEWFGDILKSCDKYLSEVILNENTEAEVDEDRIVRHLFTLGEIAQQCPEKTPKRVFMLVQSLIAAPVITSSEWNAHDNSGSDVATQGTQGTQATQVLTQFKGSKMSHKVRAHAFITLGKLCLQHEKLAKKCVPAMAKELEAAEDPCIRNNIAIILCDLCFRYTTLVDRHFSAISAGTKDDFLLIRKQTLILLTHLLQEDFLKWKGSLFFRFISAIVDDNKEIREFAEFCLVHILMKRHPNMFFNNLIECIFHFNTYNSHPAYNKFPQTEKEQKAFSLAGPANKEKRLYIYKFMLENMTDMHRFQTSSKLVQEVLAAMVDEVMPINAESNPILQDTLLALSSKEIKLASMKTKANDDVAETEQEMAQAVANAAKKKLISVVMKKNVIENTVPTVISLKHVLEKQRSPILKDLMGYLRELMKDYKDEVQDILAADRQLAREVEFDLKRFEEQQMGTPVLGSPRPGTPRRQGTPRAQGTPRSLQGSPRVAGGTPRGPIIGTPVRTPLRTPGGSSLDPAQAKRVAFANVHQGPRPTTPSRPVSMATMAILNSARKAMEKAQSGATAMQSDEEVSPLADGTSKPKKVNWSDQKESESDSAMDAASPDDVSDDNRKTFKTPKNTRVLRAISTPSTNLSMLNNITFQGDNLSMIAPPSPLLNPGLRSPSLGRDDPEIESQEKAPVIHMFSPDRPEPRPRQWNIDSPARTRTTRSRRNKEN